MIFSCRLMFLYSLLHSLPLVSCSNLKLMRIRKNSKFSLLDAQSSSGNSHICQLNQSPWDVHASDSFAYPQLHGVASTGNGSWGDSIGALDRIASLNMSMELDGNGNNYSDTEEKEEEKKETIYCGKTDANGNLLCGREAKHGHTMCDFHLVHFYKGNNVDGSKKSGKKRVKKSKLETNPYKMYYYSWFGPRWGKKRGDGKYLAEGADAVVEPMEETSDQANDDTIASTNSPYNESFEFIEDDFEDDFEDDGDEDEIMDGGNGKKRARKPIKARSLKSLM